MASCHINSKNWWSFCFEFNILIQAVASMLVNIIKELTNLEQRALLFKVFWLGMGPLNQV